MGARTTSTTSGGGTATPVANDFQAWLQSQLNGTPYNPGAQQSTQQAPTSMSPRDFLNNIDNGGNPFATNTGIMPTSTYNGPYTDPLTGQFHPGTGTGSTMPGGATNPNIGVGNSPQQGGSPFQNAFNSMISGQVLDPSGANSAIANSIAGGAQTFGQDFGNAYNSQTYNAANINQLPTNQLQGSGMADLSGVGQTAQSNMQFQPGSSQYTNMLTQLLGTGQNMLGQSGVGNASAGSANIGAGISLDPATQFDMNNPYFNALKTQQERALQQATADNNARFGAQGAGAIGTGAQLANSNLQSAASADQTVALQQALQGLQQQDLAERGTRANVGLTSRGQDAQVGIANAGNQTQASIAGIQAALQGQGQNNALFGNLMQGALTGRGQDFQNNQSAQGMGLEQSLANAGFTNTRNGQDLQALLSNQGLGNNFQMGAADLNNNAMQTNNTNAMNQANSLNGFNLTNAGNTAQYGQAANALNSQNFQNNQQGWQSMLGLGQGVNQQANQNMAAALQQLFGSFGQSTGLGIEGRNTQTNTTGSPWGGILGAALPVAGNAFQSWMNNRGRNNQPTTSGGIGYGGSMPTSTWG